MLYMFNCCSFDVFVFHTRDFKVAAVVHINFMWSRHRQFVCYDTQQDAPYAMWIVHNSVNRSVSATPITAISHVVATTDKIVTY